ncbi:hypothetical protein [Marinobacterium jannaschii]|uniref:hypothetical protein n=1 Tax=Marinobacterium jannaschii TaxID=64970 RepID=UPI000485E754|nr:hypothetical protein [Marinobacterium jannaschii]
MERKARENSVKGVSALGFQENVKAALELFMSRQKQFRLVPASEADLLIVHGDQGRDPDTLQQYYAHKYSKPGVLISSRELAWPNFICLPKPYDAGDLLAALVSIVDSGANQVSTESVGDREATRKQAYEVYQAKLNSQKQAITHFAKGRKLPSSAAPKAGATQGSSVAKPSMAATIASVGLNAGPGAAGEAARESGRVQSVRKALAARSVATATDAQEKTVNRAVAEDKIGQRKRTGAAESGVVQSLAKAAEKTGGTDIRVPAVKKDALPKTQARAAANGKPVAKKQQLSPEKKGEGTVPTAASLRQRLSGGKQASKPQAENVRPSSEVKKPAAKKVKRPDSPVSFSSRAVSAIIDPEELAQRQEMVARLCGFMPDLDLTQSDVRKRAFVNRDNTLLDCLLKARQSDKSSPLLVSGVPLILGYLPASDQFIHDIDDDMLLQLATTRFGIGELGLETKAELGVPDYDGGRLSGLKVEASTGFLWKIALLTARGRLFSDMDPEKLYQLKPIVGQDRIFVTPHADKIEKLWYGHRLSVLDVAKILKIPQRFAFSFMVGAYTLGWFQE